MATEIAQLIPSKPTIHLDSKCLPEIKDWKIGKTYTIHLKVRLKDMHEEYDDSKVIGAGFEVLKAEDCDD
jgi:hypothetical protein